MTDKKPHRGKIVSLKDRRKSAPGKVPSLKVAGRIVPHTGKEEHAALRAKILKLKGRLDGARWELCEALYEVRGPKGEDPGNELFENKKIYRLWGYSSFEKYVASEVGMAVRTAEYLTDMYEKFERKIGGALENKDPERKIIFINNVKALGWTKARLLVPVVTVENAEKWVERAAGMNSTDLERAVKAYLKEGKTTKDKSDASRLAFVVVGDQRDIIEKGLEIASKLAESESRGHQLAVMAQDFYSTNMAQEVKSPEGKALLLDGYLNKMGALLDINLIAVDKKTSKVIHGLDIFNSLKTTS